MNRSTFHFILQYCILRSINLRLNVEQLVTQLEQLVPDQSEAHMFAVRNDRAGRDVICVALFLVKNKQLDDVEARLRAKCLNLRFTFTDCTHSPEERADRRHHSACILCKVSPNLLRVLTAAAPSFS